MMSNFEASLFRYFFPTGGDFLCDVHLFTEYKWNILLHRNPYNGNETWTGWLGECHWLFAIITSTFMKQSIVNLQCNSKCRRDEI